MAASTVVSSIPSSNNERETDPPVVRISLLLLPVALKNAAHAVGPSSLAVSSSTPTEPADAAAPKLPPLMALTSPTTRVMARGAQVALEDLSIFPLCSMKLVDAEGGTAVVERDDAPVIPSMLKRPFPYICQYGQRDARAEEGSSAGGGVEFPPAAFGADDVVWNGERRGRERVSSGEGGLLRSAPNFVPHPASRYSSEFAVRLASLHSLIVYDDRLTVQAAVRCRDGKRGRQGSQQALEGFWCLVRDVLAHAVAHVLHSSSEKGRSGASGGQSPLKKQRVIEGKHVLTLHCLAVPVSSQGPSHAVHELKVSHIRGEDSRSDSAQRGSTPLNAAPQVETPIRSKARKNGKEASAPPRASRRETKDSRSTEATPLRSPSQSTYLQRGRFGLVSLIGVSEVNLASIARDAPATAQKHGGPSKSQKAGLSLGPQSLPATAAARGSVVGRGRKPEVPPESKLVDDIVQEWRRQHEQVNTTKGKTHVIMTMRVCQCCFPSGESRSRSVSSGVSRGSLPHSSVTSFIDAMTVQSAGLEVRTLSIIGLFDETSSQVSHPVEGSAEAMTTLLSEISNEALAPASPQRREDVVASGGDGGSRNRSPSPRSATPKSKSKLPVTLRDLTRTSTAAKDALRRSSLALAAGACLDSFPARAAWVCHLPYVNRRQTPSDGPLGTTVSIVQHHPVGADAEAGGGSCCGPGQSKHPTLESVESVSCGRSLERRSSGRIASSGSIPRLSPQALAKVGTRLSPRSLDGIRTPHCGGSSPWRVGRGYRNFSRSSGYGTNSSDGTTRHVPRDGGVSCPASMPTSPSTARSRRSARPLPLSFFSDTGDDECSTPGASRKKHRGPSQHCDFLPRPPPTPSQAVVPRAGHLSPLLSPTPRQAGDRAERRVKKTSFQPLRSPVKHLVVCPPRSPRPPSPLESGPSSPHIPGSGDGISDATGHLMRSTSAIQPESEGGDVARRETPSSLVCRAGTDAGMAKSDGAVERPPEVASAVSIQRPEGISEEPPRATSPIGDGGSTPSPLQPLASVPMSPPLRTSPHSVPPDVPLDSSPLASESAQFTAPCSATLRLHRVTEGVGNHDGDASMMASSGSGVGVDGALPKSARPGSSPRGLGDVTLPSSSWAKARVGGAKPHETAMYPTPKGTPSSGSKLDMAVSFVGLQTSFSGRYTPRSMHVPFASNADPTTVTTTRAHVLLLARAQVEESVRRTELREEWFAALHRIVSDYRRHLRVAASSSGDRGADVAAEVSSTYSGDELITSTLRQSQSLLSRLMWNPGWWVGHATPSLAPGDMAQAFCEPPSCMLEDRLQKMLSLDGVE